MKKISALTVLMIFCGLTFAQEALPNPEEIKSGSDVWKESVGLGLTVPAKMLFIDGNKSTGFATQLNLIYEEKKDTGMVFYVDAAIGPYFYKDLHLNDASGLCLNATFLFCFGYDFFAAYKDKSLILAGILGLDFFSFKDYEYDTGYTRKENTAICFTTGCDLVYSVKIREKLNFYLGCKALAGAGWNNSRNVKENHDGSEEVVSDDYYGSSVLLSLQPKIGLLYRL